MTDKEVEQIQENKCRKQNNKEAEITRRDTENKYKKYIRKKNKKEEQSKKNKRQSKNNQNSNIDERRRA